MTHLLAQLLRINEPWCVIATWGLSLLGGGGAMLMLAWPPATRVAAVSRVIAFATVSNITAWACFAVTLRYSFPQLTRAVPPAWAGGAIASGVLAGAAAVACHLFLRRSARNAMLSGSVLAFGQSCMIFTAMAGLVRPFALAYDLTGVLLVMLVASALWGLAFREIGNTARRWRGPLTVLIVSLAGALIPIGSFACILPLEGWMSALDQPDNLSSAPIAILVAAEAAAVLALSLFGSLVDTRTSARDKLEADRLRQLADSTFEGILVCRNDKVVDANESLAAMLGLGLEEVCTSPVARFLDVGRLAPAVAGRTAAPLEMEITTASGQRLPVEILSRTITYGGEPATVMALRDIRERKASEERIRFLAHHDALTHLPNRVSLGQRLDDAMPAPGRPATSLAVLCLDLDGFKLVNDTLGHAAGDLLLCRVAGRIRDCLGAGDVAARVGGDEFVVLHAGGEQPGAATVLAKRIIESLATSFDLDGHVVTVGTSIGIAIHPQDGHDGAVLLKKADIALYKAKHDGRGWFSLFEPGMDHSVSKRRALEQDLRDVVQNEGLALAFQPLFGADHAIVSFEALVRWTHPTRGPIPPSEFIPVAEESGIIFPLSRWVLRTACAAAAAWPQPCRVAVNLSPAQFLRGDLLAVVTEVLADTGLAPHRLELEITEGVLMDNTDGTLAALRGLRALGCRLVLDDFGTGYSSLSYLHRFPLDQLKIDRSFVQRLGSTSDSRAIIGAIVAMSRSLSLEVTAEGVETPAQFDALRAQGCHAFQGYLLGHPMGGGEVTKLLLRRQGPQDLAPTMPQVA